MSAGIYPTRQKHVSSPTNCSARVHPSARITGRSVERDPDTEFIAKIGVVLEEADESAFWLELLVECGIAQGNKVAGVLAEANELTAIFAASRITAQKKRGNQ